MDYSLWVMLITFFVLLSLEVPIAFCLGISSLAALITIGDIPAFLVVSQRMLNGMNSFTLLAIPFFILAGLFMGRGGIAKKLIDFANVLVGKLPGGLGFVNILTCMLFGSISGSAGAAVSSVGGFMIPLMNKYGYNREFNTSITVTAATTGLLIPPSNVMIIYSLATGGTVSIATIFVAGIIPGILVGLALMAMAGVIAARRNYGREAGQSVKVSDAPAAFIKALPAIFLIVIIMGGILSGVFTPTEASAIAAVYAFALSVFFYREVKLNEVPLILVDCAKITAVVLFLIGTSMSTSWILAYNNIPEKIMAAMSAFSSNKYVILLLINIILLIVGMFMDMTPAILIFTPIFLPVVMKLGVHPIHFGIIMLMNLCIGLCTPPVGTVLFIGCGIGDTTVVKVTKHLLPFFVSMIFALLICTYIEWFSLWLPNFIGLLK